MYSMEPLLTHRYQPSPGVTSASRTCLFSEPPAPQELSSAQSPHASLFCRVQPLERAMDHPTPPHDPQLSQCFRAESHMNLQGLLPPSYRLKAHECWASGLSSSSSHLQKVIVTFLLHSFHCHWHRLTCTHAHIRAHLSSLWHCFTDYVPQSWLSHSDMLPPTSRTSTSTKGSLPIS